MIKALIVGDMHVVPEELADCSKLVQQLITICRTEEIREIWWTGDQHHTHAVVRLEVLHWWKVAIKALRAQGINSVFLVGNHDQAGPGMQAHAMMAYENDQGVKVIDTPTVHRGVLMVPYMDTEKEFVAAVRQFCREATDEDEAYFPPTLFCHQTFVGSKYENGLPAMDGFDPNLVPQELIISGHIHTGQEYDKVWYVGAPRWRTLSDANVDRAVWVVAFDGGKLVDRRPFSTELSCRPIKHLEDSPDAPVQLPLDPSVQWRVDIKGPADWCQKRKIELKAAGARVRTFPIQVSAGSKVRESEGIDKAFSAFIGIYQAKFGTPRETLAMMAKERLSNA